MGDEILMNNSIKKLIILPFVAIYLNADDNRLAMVVEYKNMFSKIGEKRIGVDPRKIDSVKSPFEKVEKKQPKIVDGKVVIPKPEFVLQAIVNKRAKISGKWYRVNDPIGDLKVVSIKNSVVWLKNSEFKKRLIMRKENAKISIK
jgi:hypothetical protein